MATLITSGQKSEIVDVTAAAARKAGEEAVEELSSTGVLNGGNTQRVLAQGDKVKAVVKIAVKTVLAELAQNIVGVLKLISGASTLTIGATDGIEIPSQSADVFDGYIDSDFVAWGLDVPSAATLEIPVEVYEMIGDADFGTIFGGFGENLDRLRFSWPQVKLFAKTNRKWLRTGGYATFIPFTKAGEPVKKDKSNLFVAVVFVDGDDRLEVSVRRFSHDGVWRGEGRPRIVVPQL